MAESKKNLGPLIGIVLLIVPIGLLLLWFYACSQTQAYPENVEFFNSYLPPVLRGRFTTTAISIVLCVTAIALNIGSLNNKPLKTVSGLVVIVGGLLAFWNLFSMM